MYNGKIFGLVWYLIAQYIFHRFRIHNSDFGRGEDRAFL